jgi:hypothetical protein
MKRKKKVFLDDKLTFPFGLKIAPKTKNRLKDCYYQGNLNVSGNQLCEAVSKINNNLTSLHEVLGIQDKNEKGDHIFIGIYDSDETFTILDEKLEDIKKYSGILLGSYITPTYSKLEKEGKVIEVEVNVDCYRVKADGTTTYLDIDYDYLEELITQQIGSSQTLNLMQSMKDTFGSIDFAIDYYKKGLCKIRDCENVVNGFLSEKDEEIVKVIKILHDSYQEEHKVWLNGDDEDPEPIDPLEKDEEKITKVFIEDKKKFLDNINSYINPEFFELFKEVLPPDFRNFAYEYFNWSLNDIGYGGYRDIGVNLRISTTSLWFNLASVPKETKEILTEKLHYVLDYLKEKYKEIDDKINTLTEILAIRIPIMVYKIGVNDMIKLANISCNNSVEFVNYDSIEVISEADLSKLDSFKYYIDSQCRIIIITTKGEFYKFIPNTSIKDIKSPTFEDHIKTSLEQKVNKELELLKGKTLEHFNRIFSEGDTEDYMQDQLRKNTDYMDLVERAIDAELELKYVTERLPENMKELYAKTDWYMYQYLQGEAANGVLKQSL